MPDFVFIQAASRVLRQYNIVICVSVHCINIVWMSTSVKMKIFPRLRAKTGSGPATRRIPPDPTPTCLPTLFDEQRVLCVVYHHLPSHFLSSLRVLYCLLLACRIYKLTVAIQIHKFMQRSASSRTSKKSRWRKTGGPFDKMKSISVLTKIDLFLLPLLLLAAFLSALDKVCIAVV